MNIKSNQLNKLLREIGLFNSSNAFSSSKEKKFSQVVAYTEQLLCVLDKLTRKRAVTLLDAGCGRAYVSFYLYAYCKYVLERDIKIIGIDRNGELIEKNKRAAERLGFDGMFFHACNLEGYLEAEPIDIVYTLHACDKATDYAIAKGIKSHASYIFSVSCCQHTCRKQLKKHGLQSVTRFQAYKERLADMISDSMRALLLEHHNYGVKIYEFMACDKTPKNILLRASKNTVRKKDKENAIQCYQHMRAVFNIEPELHKLIEES